MLRVRSILLLLLPLAVLAAACSSYEPPKRDASAFSKLDTGIRHDCNAMLGTAFRATEEREWFEQNCSRWPAVAVAQVPAAGASPAARCAKRHQGDTPECAAKRGKPYTNEQDRTWFLQNCIRPEAPAPAPNPVGAPQATPATQPTPVVNANAAVCDTLRRTPNPSDEQRRWYFTYCNIRLRRGTVMLVHHRIPGIGSTTRRRASGTPHPHRHRRRPQAFLAGDEATGARRRWHGRNRPTALRPGRTRRSTCT